jgi:polysaccharide export outer membrane protein
LFGSVEIAGLSSSEAQERVRDILAESYLVDPRVIIRVVSSQAYRIVLLGEVQNPGIVSMPFEEPLTLMQAIAQAGGFTDLASINRITIVRNGENGAKELRVRVSRIVDGRDPDIPLEPNDIITVPQSIF